MAAAVLRTSSFGVSSLLPSFVLSHLFPIVMLVSIGGYDTGHMKLLVILLHVARMEVRRVKRVCVFDSCSFIFQFLS